MALDRKFKNLEASQAWNLDGKFQTLKQDLQKDIDDKMSERLTATEKRLQTMVNNANNMAEVAKSAVEKAAMVMEEPEIPRLPGVLGGATLSMDGFLVDWSSRATAPTYGERYNRGISSEYASEYMEKLRKDLTSDEADNINWERTLAANRGAYNFKMVIVVAEQDNDQAAREIVYKMKEAVARLLTKPDYHIHKTQCYVAVQASPERRALFQLAGRFSGILVELSGDDKLQTKREYGHDNLTILGWSVSDGPGGKNSHLQQRAQGTSPGGGRLRRVAEWGRRTQWRICGADCVSFGVCPATLRERLAESS